MNSHTALAATGFITCYSNRAWWAFQCLCHWKTLSTFQSRASEREREREPQSADAYVLFSYGCVRARSKLRMYCEHVCARISVWSLVCRLTLALPKQKPYTTVVTKLCLYPTYRYPFGVASKLFRLVCVRARRFIAKPKEATKKTNKKHCVALVRLLPVVAWPCGVYPPP